MQLIWWLGGRCGICGSMGVCVGSTFAVWVFGSVVMSEGVFWGFWVVVGALMTTRGLCAFVEVVLYELGAAAFSEIIAILVTVVAVVDFDVSCCVLVDGCVVAASSVGVNVGNEFVKWLFSMLCSARFRSCAVISGKSGVSCCVLRCGV